MYTSLFFNFVQKGGKILSNKPVLLKIVKCLLATEHKNINLYCMNVWYFTTVILINFDTAFVCFAFRYDTANVSFK